MMMKTPYRLQLLAFIISFFCCVTIIQAQQTSLSRGMTIRKSMKVKKGSYSLNGFDSLGKAPIVIEGDNIVVDFNHAILKGSSGMKNPDEFYGVALIIRGGKNITIKNLNAKGYKIAIIARNTDGLKIENCNLSFNYRMHLNSTQEKEDISDWLSHHHNENDEWLRYGAAIYLRACNNAIIGNCKVTGGQNALLMTQCNNGLVYNNDFTFNSGLGIGMYLSSFNKILYNKLDFNVRGYSEGVYNRGQDSAGILVYEQSNNNLFYRNSVTHGGDGFFLWAGPMETATGGCNNNILLDNDFSYAPTNGVEVTFSSNKIIHNRIFECDHGIWGGYSYNTDIKDNQFRNNRIAIAIEQGQYNDIHHNIFSKDKEGIRLWARNEQPADWKYAQLKDTRSRNYKIVGNSFNSLPLVFNINHTDSLILFENRLSNCDVVYKIDSTVTNFDSTFDETIAFQFSKDSFPEIPQVAKPIDAFKGMGKLAGRKNIMMTEWGPYNFKYPFIWNTNPIDTSAKMSFNIFGPKGHWRILSAKGVEMNTALKDSFPSSFTAQKLPSQGTDIEIIAEYKGPSFIDEMGNTVPANKPYQFRFTKFFQPIAYTVNWFDFDSANNPIKFNTIAQIEKTEAFKTEKVNTLDYTWWGGIKAGEKQHQRFLTVGEGTTTFPPGTYELSVTWDDAVRIYIDGKKVFDEWNPTKYNFNEAPHKKIKLSLSGLHHIRVEHVELGDFATLTVKFRKTT
jgi:hypothetical protein